MLYLFFKTFRGQLKSQFDQKRLSKLYTYSVIRIKTKQLINIQILTHLIYNQKNIIFPNLPPYTPTSPTTHHHNPQTTPINYTQQTIKLPRLSLLTSNQRMTKKTKQTNLSMLNRHHSQKIERDLSPLPNDLSLKKSNHKKTIKKPEQELLLIDKVEMLKDKSQKFYKHAQKKIERMIDIIDEIEHKQLGQWINGESYNHGGKSQNETIKQEQSGQSQAIKLEPQQTHKNSHIKTQQATQKKLNQSQKQLITKTLTHLHNQLTYQRPLSHIKHEFQTFYSRLSAFAKQLEPQEPLSTDKKFLIPENGLSFEDLRSVEQLIKQHYLRTGYFEVADMFDHYGQEPYVENGNNHSQDNNHKVESNPKPSKEQPKKQANKNIFTRTDNNNFLRFQNIMKLQSIKPKKSQKKKPKVQLIDLQQNFKQCFTLRHQLLSHNFTEAINWCVQQRLYETHQNPLEYNLRLTEIELLIHDKKYRIAFEKIEKDMVKFLDNYENQINMLIGYLLFSCEWNAEKIFDSQQYGGQMNNQMSLQEQQMIQSIINTRYKQFQVSTIDINQLASTFTHDYFIHYGISQFDTLQICYKVGKMYEQNYFDSIKLFSQKDREEFLKHRGHCELDDKHNGVPHSVVLPFEIPVSPQYHYHSIFVCPVTKQVLSSNDGVEYLSCGHLVSESAKKNMAQVRRSNHKQRCPVCQKDRASDVAKVRF